LKNNCILIIKNSIHHWHKTHQYAQGVLLSYQKINQMYLGVEGEAWPDIAMPLPRLQDGLAYFDEIEECETYLKTAKSIFRTDVVNFLLIGDSKVEEILGFQFAGYDCGYYLGEYNNYSALYDDLVVRTIDELSSFKLKLNSHLLFTSVDDAQAFLGVRKRICCSNTLLETDEESVVLPIYSRIEP
jgi:hypothetical protein